MCAIVALDIPVQLGAELLNLGQAHDYYLKTQARLLSPESIKAYRGSLRYLLKKLGDEIMLEDINRQHIWEWRDWMLTISTLGINTIRRIMGHTRTFFNWFVTVGILEESPASEIKMPRGPEAEPKAISIEDFEKLVTAAGFYHGGKWPYAQAYITRNTAILYFLASTGCRVGGLCSAELSTLQIDDYGGECRVTEKSRGGGKERRVMLSDTAVLAVLEWLDHRPETSHDFIFSGIEGKSKGLPMTTTAVRQFLGRLAKRAGIEGRFNPHSFRHACAREWLRNGADLQTVSQLLGHSDIRVTAKYYARWSNSELRERHKVVDWTKCD